MMVNSALELTTPPAEVWMSPPQDRCLPVVLDTGPAMQDILRLTRTRFTMIDTLATHGLTALLAPPHVEAEIEEHLPRRARESRVDPGAALEVWSHYRTRVRFVDVPPEPFADPRVAKVAAQDPDDAPVAALAVFLSPALVIAEDRDLTDHGFGRPAREWLDDVKQLHALAAVDAQLWGGATAARLATILTGAALRRSADLLARFPAAILGIMTGVALLAAIDHRDALENRHGGLGRVAPHELAMG